jgi:putative PEP-CTERM system TPR-repeat lipoprotein
MKFNTKYLLSATLIVCSLAACSPKKTSEEYIQSAQQSIVDKDDASAIIAIKNAIRINKDDAKARFLLGELYLRQGEAISAEKELKKSLDLGEGLDKVLPKLLKALNLQDKHEEVITSIDSYASRLTKNVPEVFLYEALAHYRTGNKDKAKEAIGIVNDISSGSIYSQLGNAYSSVYALDIDSALNLVSDVLDKAPDLVEAHLLQGQLFYVQKEYGKAIGSYNKYHSLLPNDLKIRLFLADSYIKSELFVEADTHLDHLLTKSPEHAFVNQLKGISLFNSQNYLLALEHIDKSIVNGLNSISNRIIAGLCSYNLKQYEKSYQYLKGIEDSISTSHPVKKVLAIVQAHLGYTAEMGETLEGFEGLTDDDAYLLTAASFELLKKGEIDKAKSVITKVDNLNDLDSTEKAHLGILKLSLDDLEGITDLEESLVNNPDLSIAKIALATAYIVNKEYTKGLALANKWKLEEPDKVDGFNLAAKIYLLQKDTEKAEKELTESLIIDKSNAYALLYFSYTHVIAKEYALAIENLDILLSGSPDHISALMLHYKVSVLLNTSQDSLKKIKLSYDRNKEKLSHRMVYARALYSEKQYKNVVEVLNKSEMLPQTLPVIHWALLGNSYIKINDNKNALIVYDNWLEVQPKEREAWVQKLSFLENLKDFQGGLNTVKKAIRQLPDDFYIQALLAHFYVEDKNFNRAEIELEKFSKSERKQPFIQGVWGKILLSKGLYSQALPALTELYNSNKTPKNTTLVVLAHRGMNNDKFAIDFLKQHLARNSSDNLSKMSLAELAITYDKELSLQLYTDLVLLFPKNGNVLNNLAWVEYKLGMYKKSNAHIEQALEVFPNHPKVLDTAGLIKLKLGKTEKAIELLKLANVLSPDDKAILQHLNNALEVK